MTADIKITPIYGSYRQKTIMPGLELCIWRDDAGEVTREEYGHMICCGIDFCFVCGRELA